MWGLFAQEASESLASPQWRGWQRAEQLYRNGKNDGRTRYWYEQVVAGGENPLLTAMSLDDLRTLATLRGDTAQAQTWRDRAISAWRPLCPIPPGRVTAATRPGHRFATGAGMAGKSRRAGQCRGRKTLTGMARRGNIAPLSRIAHLAVVRQTRFYCQAG